MAMPPWEVLDELNLAEELCPDSDEALTPQKKRKTEKICHERGRKTWKVAVLR